MGVIEELIRFVGVSSAAEDLERLQQRAKLADDAVEGLESSADNFGKAAVKLRGPLGEVSPALGELANQADNAIDAFEGVQAGLQGMGLSLGAVLGPAVAVAAAVAAMGAAYLKFSADLEEATKKQEAANAAALKAVEIAKQLRSDAGDVDLRYRAEVLGDESAKRELTRLQADREASAMYADQRGLLEQRQADARTQLARAQAAQASDSSRGWVNPEVAAAQAQIAALDEQLGKLAEKEATTAAQLVSLAEKAGKADAALQGKTKAVKEATAAADAYGMSLEDLIKQEDEFAKRERDATEAYMNSINYNEPTAVLRQPHKPLGDAYSIAGLDRNAGAIADLAGMLSGGSGSSAGVLAGVQALASGGGMAGAASAGLAAAGGPAGMVAAVAVQVLQQVADVVKQMIGAVVDAAKWVASLGDQGIAGVEARLKDFNQDFFKGLKILPTLIEDTVPTFITSFADALTRSMPTLIPPITAALIEATKVLTLYFTSEFPADLARAMVQMTRNAANRAWEQSAAARVQDMGGWRETMRRASLTKGMDSGGRLVEALSELTDGDFGRRLGWT